MGPPGSHGTPPPGPQAGFTWVEMLVVLTLVALVSALVAFSLRPSPQQQLLREGERLALWLEGVRHQSRELGHWAQVRVDATGAQRLSERPDAVDDMRLNWLYTDTLPQTPVTLTLGPEPVLPPQQLQLTHLGDERVFVRVGTRGLGPWTAQ